MADTSQYPGTQELEVLPEIDDTLQKHVLAIQETLMESVDRQMLKLGGELREKEAKLEQTVEEKEEIARGLYRAGREIFKLNTVLEKV